MGECGAAHEPASADDIAAIARTGREAMAAGSFGFSTTRTGDGALRAKIVAEGRQSQTREGEQYDKLFGDAWKDMYAVTTASNYEPDPKPDLPPPSGPISLLVD